jgi:hypothetical protein
LSCILIRCLVFLKGKATFFSRQLRESLAFGIGGRERHELERIICTESCRSFCGQNFGVFLVLKKTDSFYSKGKSLCSRVRLVSSSGFRSEKTNILYLREPKYQYFVLFHCNGSISLVGAVPLMAVLSSVHLVNEQGLVLTPLMAVLSAVKPLNLFVLRAGH